MAINFVENVDGRARIYWPGAAVLLGALSLASALIPAAGFWLWLGDEKLVSNALFVGFAITCLSFGAILGRSLRLPIEQLPIRKL